MHRRTEVRPRTSQYPRPHQSKVAYYKASVRRWMQRKPGSKPKTRLVFKLTVAFIILNCVLFILQLGRMPVGAKASGKSFSFKGINSARDYLKDEYATQQLTIHANSTTSLPLSETGIVFDSDATFNRLKGKTGLRLIPIISFFGDMFMNIKPVYKIDELALGAKLDPLFTKVDIPLKNAEIIVPVDLNKPVTITKEADGHLLDSHVAIDAVISKVKNHQYDVTIKELVSKPIRIKTDVEGFMSSIEAARKRTMTIEGNGKKIELSRTTLVPMLKVDGDSKNLSVNLDVVLLMAYLNKQTDPYYQAPEPVKVTKRDGVETGRTKGTPGKKLDVNTVAPRASLAFEQGKTTTPAVLADIIPEVKTFNTYTETDQALHKVIEDFAKSHTGKYYVAAVELKGPGHRSAFYNADTSLVAASTYKVFIAYGILQKIEAGTLTKNTRTPRGSVGYCMERAMIVSDNDCASALQTVLGWAAFDTKLKEDGFKATTLNNYYTGDKLSTARDEMAALTRIYNHELVNAESADYLFGLMKQQTYVQGIIAGSRGAEVAAKVGFLDAYYHDVGIVYAPKATYALVIMTDGAGGFNNIRLLSEKVYDYYNK